VPTDDENRNLTLTWEEIVRGAEEFELSTHSSDPLPDQTPPPPSTAELPNPRPSFLPGGPAPSPSSLPTEVKTSPHVLYRFWDAAGHLLYVGITADPLGRWKTHSKDKDWWSEVVNITVENFPNRSSVIDAERTAIITEKPLYNKVHNKGDKQPREHTPTSESQRALPLQVGDWAALGCKDGTCPVGEIEAADEEWVSVRLKSFMFGYLTDMHAVRRWTDIERIEVAYPEDKKKTCLEDRDYSRHHDSYVCDCPKVMDDVHLGRFQTAWTEAHDLDDTRLQQEFARYDKEHHTRELENRRK
jgi:predicted GIY-YIG superfamily endonuclease